MSPNPNDSEDRKAMLTRFIVFYVICVLCITVPLYYLFNIPDKVLSQLSASRFMEKNEQEKIDRINTIIAELDQYVKENKYEKEYKYCYEKLYTYAKDSIDQSVAYKIYVIKVSDLYQRIKEIYEQAGKEEIERLQKEVESKDKELDDCKEKFEKEKEKTQELTTRNQVLQMK
ncbi:MAG: hypothetical protein ACOYN4_01710 [Bacteroidales bacterium]